MESKSSYFSPLHRLSLMSSFPARKREAILADLQQARRRVQYLEEELAAAPSTSSAEPSQEVDRDEHRREEAAKAENSTEHSSAPPRRDWPLSLREYKRYGRQMMLSGVGLPGQLKLKSAHVLVVGAGGLGCPVLLYLAAAGVGEITILDHDTVELSNLHRQVLHTEGRVGMGKAESAKIGLEALNSDIAVHALSLAFTPSLFHSTNPSFPSPVPSSVLNGSLSLILDCTDNPATRHFLNAYSVAHRIPLVSGGAVRAEGTVGAYGLPLKSKEGATVEQEYGPCYACIFPPSPPPANPPTWPTPPPNETERLEREQAEDTYYEKLSLAGTGACSDEGVLGILCGVVGIGMAAEAVKVILGSAQPSLHLFSPLSPTSPYRTIKTRARKPTCPACGNFPISLPSSSLSSSPSTEDTLSTPNSRWSAFLSSSTGTWPGWVDPLCELPGIGSLASANGRKDERIRVEDLRDVLRKGGRVVDTRPAAEFGIAHVEGSVNIPFSQLLRNPALALPSLLPPADAQASSPNSSPASPAAPPAPSDRVTFICRRGNDSLLAARAVKRYLATQSLDGPTMMVDDVVGGVTAWAKEGEEGFPVY
ncbi:hypothetical protein JCM11251_006631 [Rhodosporidiobolus azoricus]